MLQNAAPTPLGTHEHSRVHFLILRSGLPLLNRVGTKFIGVTQKKNGLVLLRNVAFDRLGHRSLRMVYWGHTKGTALFCCRMRPRPLWAHTSTRGSISDPKTRAPSTKSSWAQSISGSGNRGRILPRQILFVQCSFYSGPVADLGADLF